VLISLNSHFNPALIVQYIAEIAIRNARNPLALLAEDSKATSPHTKDFGVGVN